MTSISANLQAVRARLAAACHCADRSPSSVRLLAVSKTWPVAALHEAIAVGQTEFGESYVQEALEKIRALAATSTTTATTTTPLIWHFIGPLQSNKTRPVAEHFDWVHSIERLKIAERLSAQRPAACAPLQVCIQVNVSGEASKSGCAPHEAQALAQAVAALPRLRLRGLMAIPEPSEDIALQRRRFALLRQLKDQLNATGLALDTLSMGMSHDLEAAILEGATQVRIGTAIFGGRDYAPAS